MKLPQRPEHGKELWDLSELLAQFPRPETGFLHFYGGVAPSRDQRDGQADLQPQLLLSAARAFRQRIEQIQSSGEVCDRFDICEAPQGSLARLHPEPNGLRV